MPDVILTEQHERLAYHIACARDLAAQLIGRTPAHGAGAQGSDDALAANIDGARAEVAFWEMTGRECQVHAINLMPNLGELEGDAIWRGKVIEIRSTAYTNGHLIVHPHERPERFYVLCIADHPLYRFPGYLRGQDAQIGCYLRDPDPRGERNFWIPQDHLSAWRL
jgi:hypothetical protein